MGNIKESAQLKYNQLQLHFQLVPLVAVEYIMVARSAAVTDGIGNIPREIFAREFLKFPILTILLPLYIYIKAA